MKIGFVINPLAGIGGSVALKGSDGQEIVQQALARGALPQAQLRAKSALEKVKSWTTSSSDTTTFFTASKEMGEDVLDSLGIDCEFIYSADAATSATDTKHTIRAFVEKQVDLIIFAGGDGTARDVLDVLDVEGTSLIPVIGIPAGVKISFRGLRDDA